MTSDQIKNVIQSSKANLSAKGIAAGCKLDPTSELLNQIRHTCCEMCETGELVCFTTPEGIQFFGMA